MWQKCYSSSKFIMLLKSTSLGMLGCLCTPSMPFNKAAACSLMFLQNWNQIYLTITSIWVHLKLTGLPSLHSSFWMAQNGWSPPCFSWLSFTEYSPVTSIFSCLLRLYLLLTIQEVVAADKAEAFNDSCVGWGNLVTCDPFCFNSSVWSEEQ